MSTWQVNVGGRDRTVRMESPVLGRKIIFVDGEELKKVGTPISMWSSYPLDLDGTPAVIKFRAIKRMKGMSLYVNGEHIDAEPGGHSSAETVQAVMLVVAVALIGFLAYALISAGK